VAGQLGYCGLDRGRQPLTGEEIRGCWEGWTVATGTSVPLTVAAARPGEEARPPLEFVEVSAAASVEGADEPSEDPPVAPPNRRSPDPGWSLWGDLEP